MVRDDLDDIIHVEETYENEEERKVAEKFEKQVEEELKAGNWKNANHLLGCSKEDDEESAPKFAFSGLAAAAVKKKPQK